MHFEVGDKSVPVSDVSPSPRPGVIVDTGQAKSGWNKCSGGFPIRAKSFAIEKQFGIEFSRSPTIQHLAHRRLRNSQLSRSPVISAGSRGRNQSTHRAGSPTILNDRIGFMDEKRSEDSADDKPLSDEPPKRAGGGGGIRTHEGLRPAGFQDRSHQPLDHPSHGSAWHPAVSRRAH